MIRAEFRFYASLNDFLPDERKQRFFSYEFENHQSVKHLIEAFGVPHPEVARILADGAPRNFSFRDLDGAQVEVYPHEALTAGISPLVPDPDAPRFILDNHLGRLAAYLRMLGFDSLYRNDYQDEELSQVSGEEGRILLTRDQKLLMRSIVLYGYWVRSKTPARQIEEVSRRYRLLEPPLNAQSIPFRRCLRCNALLHPIAKEDVLDRLEPLTKQYYHEFHICPNCGQVYWKGSHYERMLQMIDRVKAGKVDEEEEK